MPKKMMNQLQTIALSKKLDETCRKVNGHAVYSEGWDDLKVLAAMGDEYTFNNVVGLRKVMFGEIAKAPKLTLDAIARRVEQLEQVAVKRVIDLEALRTRMATLEASLTKLEEWATDHPQRKFVSNKCPVPAELNGKLL